MRAAGGGKGGHIGPPLPRGGGTLTFFVCEVKDQVGKHEEAMPDRSNIW